MGLFSTLLGKNDTGIIVDISGISVDNVHITLRYLSELFQTNPIVCVTNSDNLLDINSSNIYWGARIAQFTNHKHLMPMDNVQPNSPIKGINFIDKDYFIQFTSNGIFDRLKKAVIFTDDINMVKSSLQWTPIEKPSQTQADLYYYKLMKAYTEVNEGNSTSSNDLVYSFATFYIDLQRDHKFLGRELEFPSFDIGKCIHYIWTYINYK